jgi:hypothetical protein
VVGCNDVDIKLVASETARDVERNFDRATRTERVNREQQLIRRGASMQHL